MSLIIRRGGIGYIREASLLFDSPYERACPDGAFKRGEAPLLPALPLPLLREGGQGDRLLNNHLSGQD